MLGLNGIGGMLIATALLLSILGVLGTWAVGVQNAQAQNFYTIDKPQEIKMIDKAAMSKVVDVK